MALPTYTLADLADAVKHAIGGSPDARTDTTEIINNALQFLCRAHPWTWRRKTRRLDISEVTITSLVRSSNITTVTKTTHGLAIGDTVRITSASTGFDGVYVIATVPNANSFTIADPGDDETAADAGVYITGHIALPTDVESILSLQPGSLTRSFAPCSVDQLQIARQSASGAGGFGYLWTFGYSSQAAVTAAPIARIELHPVPSAAASDLARIVYHRTIDNLANNTDVPDVPVFLHPVLKQLCRQFATQDEDQDDWKKIEGSRAEAMLTQAIEADGQSMPVAGRLGDQLGLYGGGCHSPFPPQAMNFA
jgi:hypothetical protein